MKSHTTIEMQKLMQAITAQGSKDMAYILLAIPMGTGDRDMKWICNCHPQDGAQLVIDAAKLFQATQN